MSAEKWMNNLSIGSVRKYYVICLSIMLLFGTGSMMQPSWNMENMLITPAQCFSIFSP